MHKYLTLILILILAGCSKRSKEEQEIKQALEVPILICQKDGVCLYKIRDSTEGGLDYVYFTTDGEGNKTHHQTVPGKK